MQIDVFTERPLTGNALAVCLDGRELTTEQMQAIARETNLSETTFVVPGFRPVSVANADRGVTSIQEPVTALRDAGGLKEVVTDSGTHTARNVVIASGARLKKLGVPGEAEFEGRGVSSCAD